MGETYSLGNDSPFVYVFWGRPLIPNCAWETCENSLYIKLTLPGILNGHSVSSIHRRETFYTYKHWVWVYVHVCLPSVPLCFVKAPDHGVVPIILCDHEGRETVQQFFAHSAQSISTQLQLLLPVSLPHSGIVMQHYNTICHCCTQSPAVFYCFQAGQDSVVLLEAVFFMDFVSCSGFFGLT